MRLWRHSLDFVPNQAPEMDDQNLRATYAYASGLGLRLRASELSRAKATVDIAISDNFGQELRRRSARLTFCRRRGRGGRGNRTARSSRSGPTARFTRRWRGPS